MGEQNTYPQRSRNGVNINTIIQLCGFLLLIGGLGVSYGQLLGQIERQEVAVEQHGSKIETLRTDMSQVDNLRYRLSAVEQSNTQLARSVDEMKAILSNQSADMRVIREILGRVENALNKGKTTTPPERQ